MDILSSISEMDKIPIFVTPSRQTQVRSAAAEGEVSGLEVPKKEGGDFVAKKPGEKPG